MTPDVLTPEEAANYLRISRPTLLKAVRAGELPVLRVGYRWRVSRAVLDSYLAGEQDHVLAKTVGDRRRRKKT